VLSSSSSTSSSSSESGTLFLLLLLLLFFGLFRENELFRSAAALATGFTAGVDDSVIAADRRPLLAVDDLVGNSDGVVKALVAGVE